MEEPTLPLLNIPLHLQKKITGQLEKKSYCRMQQTCKHMLELVQKYPRLKVFVHGEYDMDWELTKDGVIKASLTRGKKRLGGQIIKYGAERFPYGVCFEAIKIDFAPEVELFAGLLKDHRITAREVTLSAKEGLSSTNGYGQLLLRVLKPRQVDILCHKTVAYEAILQHKSIEKLSITGWYPEPGEAIPIVKQFLSISRDLTLYVDLTKLEKDLRYYFVKDVMELLNCDAFPNLQSLRLWVSSFSSSYDESSYLKLFDGFFPTKNERPNHTLTGHLRYGQSPFDLYLNSGTIILKYTRDLAIEEGG